MPPPSSRIPPLLQPVIRLSDNEPFILLTSTLGASANWLTIRFLCDSLTNSNPTTAEATQGPGDAAWEGAKLVLVSWMRDYDFWKQEARKSGGLDLDRLRSQNKFAFVDGLSELVIGGDEDSQNKIVGYNDRLGRESRPLFPSSRGPQTLPARGPAAGGILPARGPAPARENTATTKPQVADTTEAYAMSRDPSKSTLGNFYKLKSPNLADLKSTLTTAITSLEAPPTSTTTCSTPSKTLLILDNPDLLLSLSPPNAATQPTPLDLSSLLLTLLHSTTPKLPLTHILTHIQSDTPLLSQSTPAQPLELAQHNFLVRMAHLSQRIISVRVLDTGVARDVSGVMRVTEQKMAFVGLIPSAEDEREREKKGAKGEWLYQVKGDGSVRVFERGAGD